MINISIYKNDLRQKILNQRKIKTCMMVSESSEQVFLLSKNFLKQGSVVTFYHPINNEINLQLLWDYALKEKCTILLPRVISPTEMIFCPFRSPNDLVQGNFNILEPTTKQYKKNIDVMFIPGLAYDKKGMRLGYGAGYYDRFLKNRKVQKVGVCYHEEFLASIPNEEHDITMDYVLTDQGLYSMS